MARPPPMYRVARALRRAGLLALVVILVFLGSALASALSLRPSSASAGAVHVAPAGNDLFRVSVAVNLSNPTFYSLSNVKLEARIAFPNGSLLAHGFSPSVDVAPGTTGEVPLRFLVNLSDIPGAATMLTHDLELPSYLRLSATYATLFGIGVNASSNVSWGAPFANLNVTPTPPVLLSNGTLAESAHVAFDDHANYAVVGTFVLTLRAPGGATCGAAAIPLNVPGHGSYASSPTIYARAACASGGVDLLATFTGPTLSLTLPPTTVPP
ncbi:MAG TPA: hypothetical protein VFF67_05970 [Thermoplasmata archaeon]|nr:hypothetical protein [Thermoplasmata archaeon]